MRKSGLTFLPMKSASQAMAHNERDSAHEPSYLLPEEYRQPPIIISGSLEVGEVIARQEQRKAGLSPQAKAKGAEPIWEGVLVLPENLDGIEAKLEMWRSDYEAATGHQVLHLCVHRDEGAMVEGAPHFNYHAHCLVDRCGPRLDSHGIRGLRRKELAEVQTLTAKALGMERGSTLEERGGKHARKHVPHAQWRYKQEAADAEHKADLKRLGEEHQAELRQVKAEAQDKLMEVHSRLAMKELENTSLRSKNEALKEEMQAIKEHYKAERAALIASGQATQADYQQLKAAHQAALQELKDMRDEKAEPMLTLKVGREHKEVSIPLSKWVQWAQQQGIEKVSNSRPRPDDYVWFTTRNGVEVFPFKVGSQEADAVELFQQLVDAGLLDQGYGYTPER